MEAEASIRRVQTAGNNLEERVRVMGEEALQVRIEQVDKMKGVTTRQLEMEDEITQLQQDILDQDAVNKEQQAKICHLENIVADLVGRLTAAEDKAK